MHTFRLLLPLVSSLLLHANIGAAQCTGDPAAVLTYRCAVQADPEANFTPLIAGINPLTGQEVWHRAIGGALVDAATCQQAVGGMAMGIQSFSTVALVRRCAVQSDPEANFTPLLAGLNLATGAELWHRALGTALASDLACQQSIGH